MGKSCHNDILDASHAETALADLMTVCSAEPTTRTEAVTTFKLADVALAGGDFTNADGDVSGRKVTVAAKSAVPVDASGTATHVALVDATRLLRVTTCTSQPLTSGNTVNFPAHKYELADPA